MVRHSASTRPTQTVVVVLLVELVVAARRVGKRSSLRSAIPDDVLDPRQISVAHVPSQTTTVLARPRLPHPLDPPPARRVQRGAQQRP